MIAALKVGADPELFVKQDGEFVSGHALISGTKEEPFFVEDGAVQVDGMALEFNIMPAEDSASFVSNINSVMAQLSDMVVGYELAVVPVAEFSEEVLKNQPLEALELGCEPDFNAWSQTENCAPEGGTFRTAAGHVHVGWTEDQDVAEGSVHAESAMAMARQLDFYLGLPSILFDKDTKRRELYGRAGACRVKPYGVEYRVLSNVWLQKDEYKTAIFNNVQAAFQDMKKGKWLDKIYGNIEEIINNSDRTEALKIMNKAGVKYASFL